MANDRNSFDKSAVNQAGPGVRARNPHVFTPSASPSDALKGIEKLLLGGPVKKRIRQSGKPVLNKLESEWLERLKRLHPDRFWHAQAITVRLGNGVRYTVDLFAFRPSQPSPIAWEVKGPWATDDSIVKLKMAATIFPEINFWLAWKDKSGQWQTQEIFP